MWRPHRGGGRSPSPASHDLAWFIRTAVAGGTIGRVLAERSALVAQAIREYLDRQAVAAAAAWHASLDGEDAAVFAEFNSTW